MKYKLFLKLYNPLLSLPYNILNLLDYCYFSINQLPFATIIGDRIAINN